MNRRRRPQGAEGTFGVATAGVTRNTVRSNASEHSTTPQPRTQPTPSGSSRLGCNANTCAQPAACIRTTRCFSCCNTGGGGFNSVADPNRRGVSTGVWRRGGGSKIVRFWAHFFIPCLIRSILSIHKTRVTIPFYHPPQMNSSRTCRKYLRQAHHCLVCFVCAIVPQVRLTIWTVCSKKLPVSRSVVLTVGTVQLKESTQYGGTGMSR